MNSIILFSVKGIFIIQIINKERIQVNKHIKLFDNTIHYLNFIKEEKVIYLTSFMIDEILKLKFKKKLLLI